MRLNLDLHTTDRKEETHMAAMIFWMIAFATLTLVTAFGEWLVEKLKPKPNYYWRKEREKRHKQLVTHFLKP